MLPKTKSKPKDTLSNLTTLGCGPSKIGKSTWCSKADDAWFNAIIIMACLLLAVLAGCGAGYAYAQRRRPAPIQSQAQLLRQNYAHGIYADELADWHD